MNYEKENQIRKLAYYKWQQAGSPEGDGVEFWLDAEREQREFVALGSKDHMNDAPTESIICDQLVYNRNFDLVPKFTNRGSILNKLEIERPIFTMGFDKGFSGPVEHILP